MRSELTKKIFKKFLMFSFKACGIIEFSKIEFSDFSGTGLYVNHFLVVSIKVENCFQFFTENVSLLLPVPCSAGANTNLPLNSNILKTVKLNVFFTLMFSKEYSISFLMISTLSDFSLGALRLLMFKVCGTTAISKIDFCNFYGTERVKMAT